MDCLAQGRSKVTNEERMQRELQPLATELCKAKGWELGEFLGAGATAATFEVKTPEGLRALKLYAPKFLGGKRGVQVRRRFEMVVEHLKGHDCQHLIAVYEGAEFKNSLYMLMQRAPGKCLAKVLKSVPPGNIREIVRQIATAAKFLEKKGICHRDIKSDNIVITDDFSSAVLLDLGVVRWLDEDGIGTDQEGQLPFVATAQYSSPEYMFRLNPPGPDLWRGLTGGMHRRRVGRGQAGKDAQPARYPAEKIGFSHSRFHPAASVARISLPLNPGCLLDSSCPRLSRASTSSKPPGRRGWPEQVQP